MNSLIKQLASVLLLYFISSHALLSQSSALKTGPWRGELLLENEIIPFEFQIEFLDSIDSYYVVLKNGPERIDVGKLVVYGDSLSFQFPVFDASIRAKVDNYNLSGTFYNDARSTKNRIPFRARHGYHTRFKIDKRIPAELHSRYKVEFVYKGTKKSMAVAELKQDGNQLNGTFLTSTGDYRYLNGAVTSDSMYLSCFDGAHAFLFKAEVDSNGNLQGGFWSGDHWYESWTGIPDDNYQLADPDTLTHAIDNEEPFRFSFLAPNGELVDQNHEDYTDKVLLVQILGTWCPNCRDESEYLREVATEFQDEDFAIVGLAFELKLDTGKAFWNINRLREHLQLPYRILFAGKSGRTTASAAVPQLDHVMAYPTTLFLDRSGKIRRIHTGFSGPATGKAYDKLRSSFSSTIRQLLSE